MDCADLFAALRNVTDPDVQKRITAALTARPGLVYELWYPWRKRSHLPIHRDTWVWLFRTAGFTENYEPAQLPEKPIFLYRGASDDRRLGMAWTTNYWEAKKFATQDGRDRPYAGNVYAHWAAPVEMLARYASTEDGKYWDEIVLDHRYLNDSNVHLYEVSNYWEMYVKCITEGRRTDFRAIA